MTDDLSVWGATADDEALLPRPECRRIGERLFVRPRGMEPGKAARLPLRLTVEQMEGSVGAGSSGSAQLDWIVRNMCDEVTQQVWADLDNIDTQWLATDFFAAVRDLCRMPMGESSR